MIVYGDDDNYTSSIALATNATGNGDREVRVHQRGRRARRATSAADSTANLPAGVPEGLLRADGVRRHEHHRRVLDRRHHVDHGRPPGARCRRTRRSACSRSPTRRPRNPVAKFDSFTLSGAGTAAAAARRPARARRRVRRLEPRQDRWNAIVREDAALKYTVAGGNADAHHGRRATSTPVTATRRHAQLHPPVRGPRGRGLDDRDQARRGDDRRRLRPGRPASSTSTATTTSSSTRSPTSTTPRINRLELRSEVRRRGRGEPGRPADRGRRDHDLAAADQGRRRTTRASTRCDGTTWTAFATPVTNAMAAPGVRPLRVRAAGRGPGRHSCRSTTSRSTAPDAGGCSCTGDGNGDEFDGASARQDAAGTRSSDEDATKYTVADGGLKVTTVAGDIYANERPAEPELLLQSADHAGAGLGARDEALAARSTDGYEQGGLVVCSDDDNYVKFDAISDVRTDPDQPDRAALARSAARRSRTRSRTPTCPPGTTNIWLRLTKTGTTYKGEYSFDGTTWTTFGDGVHERR